MNNLPIHISTSSNRYWAIQLKNTERKSFYDNETSTIIKYKFDGIGGYSSLSQADISIDVAKKHPEYSVDEIKNIASGIFGFVKLREGDGILGVYGGKEVKKVGRVSNIRNVLYLGSIEVNINWYSEVENLVAKNNIFKNELEIQKVTESMFKSINLPAKYYSKFNDISYERISNLVDNLNFETFEEELKEDKGGVVSLFYGTNRSYSGSPSPNIFFGSDIDELKFGICEVIVPRGHTQGDIERPIKFIGLQFPENSNKHFVLNGIKEMSEQDFLNKMSMEIEQLGDKSALIFIHGFNTTFLEAAHRTAQIAWDVPFNGVSGFFSWPSEGSKLDYLEDIEKADSSITYLEKFIKTFIVNTNIEKVHLIAHSMGNRILTVTLNNLSENEDFIPKLRIVHQIVLAAPDIDQTVFRNNILPKLKNIGARRTLYSSDKDNALNFSETIRMGRPRLGDAGNEIFLADGLDTIDASNVKSRGNNHSYVFETKELISDLFYLLGKGFEPQDRRLQARLKDSFVYWLFPK